MNILEKIVYYYEYLFYKEYICFNCGIDFRMKKMEEEDERDTSPACSYSCLMAGLGGPEKSAEIKEFRNKYGKDWKNEYIKYLKTYRKKKTFINNLKTNRKSSKEWKIYLTILYE